MKKFIFQIAPMVAGLIIAQCLSTLHVYISNIQLYESLNAISKAGYFIVPSKALMESLVHFRPAFLGALLFTFSIGAGITIYTMTILWFRAHFFLSNKVIFFLMLPSSVAALYYINLSHFLPIASLYFLLIPLGVSLMHIKKIRHQKTYRHFLTGSIPFIGIVLLGFLWATQYSEEMFTTVRDRLLFSNSMGKKIVDFYYAYNLYPIQAIKSLSQKTLRTCDLSNIAAPNIQKETASILERYEYLNIGKNPKADVQVNYNNGILQFKNNEHASISTTYDHFKKHPWQYLNEYSNKSDPYGPFRRVTFFSLLLGLPISLYLFIFYFFESIASCFVKDTISPWVSMVVCILLGGLMLIPIMRHYPPLTDKQSIDEALHSKDVNERLHALKTIHDRKMDIESFPSYVAFIDSPHVAERYWLARSLSLSKSTETLKVLISLLSDPHPNVLCQTYYSLGVRKEQSTVKLILDTFEERPHWYAQWYGYRTLRKLGWKQKKSN